MNWDNLFEAEARSRRDDRREWSGEIGGQAVTLYSSPLCPADHEFLAKKGHRDFLMNPSLPGMALLLIHKCEDENGKRVFVLNKHLPIVSRWGDSKISDIFGELFGPDMEPETDESFEERVGNSGPTKSD